ncbi:MAG: lysophospholipid acyltransferase family protein [Chthoniobacterales bacterium]
MTSGWKKLRHRVEYIVVRAIEALVPMLPRRAYLLLADLCGSLAYFLHVPGRQVAIQNVEAAFGSAMSRAEKRRVVRRSYQYFARAMGDLFWGRRLTEDNLAQFIDVTALTEFIASGGAKRGVIFACPHYGGFEWIPFALALSGIPSTVVTQSFKNPLLNGIFNRLREVRGIQTIRRERAILRLYKALVSGRSIALAVDLTVSAKLPSVPITCFGLQTCVTFAHAWLHRRTGAVILPAHCEPLADGRYRLVLHPVIEIAPNATDHDIAQACWDRFEPMLRQKPAPWLWMYKHWRYRPAEADRRYPDYANESPHFRKLLARSEKEKLASAES